MNGPTPATPPPFVPRWQARLAAVSLVLLSLLVILPVVATLLLLWGVVLFIAGAGTLSMVGALEEHALNAAVWSAAGLLTVTALVSIVSRVSSFLRRPPPGLRPAATIRPRRAGWIVRHPWISTAVLALVVDGCLVPGDTARVIHLPPGLLGTGIVTGAVLLLLFAAYALLRLWWIGVRKLWESARRSSFSAGAVMAGSLAVTLAAFLLGNAFTRTAAALEPRELHACKGSVLDCSRQIAGTAALRPGSRGLPLALPPAGVAVPDEPPPSFDRCIEELHRMDEGGMSARDNGLVWARSILRDDAAAEDIVHATLLSVCLGSERVVEIRSYFFKSVINAARREVRRNRWYCPLVPDEPTWAPDACIDDSLLRGVIQKEMEASAYGALCSLSADERRVIEMHLWEHLPHAEIARRLRCSEAAARQRYHRALDALREQFRQRCR